MNAKGIVRVVGEPEKIGEIEKVMVVIDCTVGDGQYPHYLAIDFFGDKSILTNGLSQGQLVSVEFSVRSRESKSNKGRWFTSLSGRSVDILSPVKKERKPIDEEDEIPF